MKAWHVFAGDPKDGSLLVFALTRNRARWLGIQAGLWYPIYYLETSAIRAPKWDQYSTEEQVFETNRDLPFGAEPFYEEGV